MNPLVAVRLALVIAGITLFGLGIRGENDVMRWVGIACIAVSVAIRIGLGIVAGRR